MSGSDPLPRESAIRSILDDSRPVQQAILERYGAWWATATGVPCCAARQLYPSHIASGAGPRRVLAEGLQPRVQSKTSPGVAVFAKAKRRIERLEDKLTPPQPGAGDRVSAAKRKCAPGNARRVRGNTLDLLEAPLRDSCMATTTADAEVLRILRALSDPNRFRVFCALRGMERCVRDLVATEAMAQPLVSHHLRVLERAGLVRARRSSGFTLYALDPDGLAVASAGVTALLDPDSLGALALPGGNADCCR